MTHRGTPHRKGKKFADIDAPVRIVDGRKTKQIDRSAEGRTEAEFLAGRKGKGKKEEPKKQTQREEAGELVRKPSEGGNIPASEVDGKLTIPTFEGRKTPGEIGKEVLKGAFPEEDPIRDLTLAVLPVGRAGNVAKGISKLGAISKGTIPTRGVGVTTEIGRINKFAKATKGEKATQVGKITKKGNIKTPYQTNAKSIKQTNSLLLKVAKQFKNPAVIVGTIGAMLSTYPWSEWALGEAKEGMIFNVNKAIATGDIDLLNEFLETSDEIFDINLWETIRRLIPGANLQFAFGEKAQALMAQKKVNDRIIQDEKIKIETGETEDDRWKRIREEEAESDKEKVDYYNEQRKLMVQWEAEARRNQRNDDAEFWRKEREKQRVKEAEDRKAIADFWIEYRKTAQKLNEDSRPSNLNFGLL